MIKKKQQQKDIKRYKIIAISSLIINVFLVACLGTYLIVQQRSPLTRLNDAANLYCDKETRTAALKEALEDKHFSDDDSTEARKMKALFQYECSDGDSAKYFSQGFDRYLKSLGLPKYQD